jgi:hypothetical protein
MFAPWLLPRNTSARRSTRRFRRPAVECLEDRCVPAVINVISTADNTNPVVTAGHAGTVADPFLAPSLRSAISFVNNATNGANNVINLAVSGTYKITLAGTPGETDNAAGEFAILPTGTNGSSLTIQNTSGGTATVDANHLNRVFDINPSNATTSPKFAVTMSGFTITGGDAFDPNPANADGPTSTGGGIRDQNNVSLTLTNMVITRNVANADGGGVVMENTVNSSWTLTVTNSTISNNHAGDAGGGIDTDGMGTVVITNCTITGNTDSNQGAGVYIDAIQVGAVFVGAPMTMTGTVVSDNQALLAGTLGPPAIGGSGGGISNAGNGTMTIANSTVANNIANGVGGGFSDENAQGTLVVSNSLFFDNSAVGSGGGIQEGGPSTTITNSVIQGNTSGATGGGLFLNGTAVSIADCTIVDNTALGGGGGLEIQTTGTGAGGTTITNATITANSATGNPAAPTTANGGGIEAPATTFTGSLTLTNDTINGNFATNGGGIFWGGTTGSVAVQNTIVAHNFAGTGPDANNPSGTFTDKGGNLIGSTSGNTGLVSISTSDPLLGPLTDNGGPTAGAPGSAATVETEALLAGSPALDKGVAAGAPTTDERGFPRPDVGTAEKPDVGAFEFQDVTLAVQVTPASGIVPLFDTTTFTVTVTNTSGNALPADNSVLTVTLPAGLTSPGGPTRMFTVGALGAGQSRSFTVSAIAAALGTQTVTASTTSPDTSPATVMGAASVSVLPIIPNARVPAGTPLSAPFANLVRVRTTVVRQGRHRFLRVTITNNTADIIFGRLVLFGFSPTRFRTGLTFRGAPALDIQLAPNGITTIRLPFVRNFFPVVVAGL